MGLRAVLFDLDGTLIDSAADLQAGLNGLLKAIGRPTLTVDQVKGMIGDGAGPLVQRALAATGAPATEAALPELVQRFLRLYTGSLAVQRTRLYPQVSDVLRDLAGRGLALGICTNKPYRATMGILSALDVMDRFAEVVGGDSLPQRKPDPAPVHLLMRKLQVTAAETVFVGDSRNDVEAARAAGVPSIIVGYGYAHQPPEQLGADLVIDRFRDLPRALDLIESRRARGGGAGGASGLGGRGRFGVGGSTTELGAGGSPGGGADSIPPLLARMAAVAHAAAAAVQPPAGLSLTRRGGLRPLLRPLGRGLKRLLPPDRR